jgi:hypothetical protein
VDRHHIKVALQYIYNIFRVKHSFYLFNTYEPIHCEQELGESTFYHVDHVLIKWVFLHFFGYLNSIYLFVCLFYGA